MFRQEWKIWSIYGSEAEQSQWRIRNNQEWCQVCKDLDTAAVIKREMLEWIGHLVRMDHVTVVTKILESKHWREEEEKWEDPA